MVTELLNFELNYFRIGIKANYRTYLTELLNIEPNLWQFLVQFLNQFKRLDLSFLLLVASRYVEDVLLLASMFNCWQVCSIVGNYVGH